MPARQSIPPGATPAPLNNPFTALSAAGLPAGPADPPATAARSPKVGRVVLRRETAHRGGKTVIVVDDFAAHVSLAAIEGLASQLKKHCGCGGTVRERRIEIQGDQPARIRTLLEAAGFQVAGVR
jgi:translation initiation factor 1